MSTTGLSLFSQVSGALWDLLNQCRSDASTILAAQGPDANFAGTTLDGRLLTAIDPNAISSQDAATTALLNALKKLLPNQGQVSLHGFDPGDGQVRGLALVFALPGNPVTVVAALTGAGPSGIAFEIAALGTGAFGPATINLMDGWSIDLSGDVQDGARLQFPRGASIQILDPGKPVKADWTLHGSASTDNPMVIGPADGPHLEPSTISLDAATKKDSTGTPEVVFKLSLSGAKLILVPDVLAALIGNAVSLPVDLEIDADAENGLSLGGNGLRVTIPVNADLPGVDLKAVVLDVKSGASGLEFDAGVSFNTSLPGLPINFTVDGFGAGFPLTLSGGKFGIDPGGVHATMPTGFGVSLSLPVLSGGGFLGTTGSGAWGGVLDLDLIELTVQAFGLLQLPEAGKPLAFVGILSVSFPIPGIQLGFGFSLLGIGGVVAVNRRLDQTALQAAVVSGSADQLLFPVDPAAHAMTIIGTLGKVFPLAEGHLIIGPMVKICWGGRILSLVVAIAIDLPSPVQLVIVGRLTLSLPDPDAPLVLLQATLAGGFQLSPNLIISMIASLAGSKIGGIPLHGDMYFLLRGGDESTFVLSVGGFHPQYVRPSGVPALSRIQIAITPPGYPGIRSETYFAVTSNSVQFGAHLELCDEIAGCGVDGWFFFDALFVWDPVFAFSVHASAGVAVQVFGDTLMGVHFDLVLEGPAPWHIHGTGSISLFLFSVSLGFDVSWGSAPPALLPPPDLGPVLAAALANPSAWVTSPQQGDTSMITLSAQAAKSVQDGQMMHPLGQLTVHQRAVPLGIQISRYQNQPIPAQTWNIVAADLTANTPATLGAQTFDEFAPGAFLNLSQDEKLTYPSFDNMLSGVVLTPNDVISGDLRSVNTDFETVLIPAIQTFVPPINFFALYVAEMLLTMADPITNSALWSAPGQPKVAVLSAQPLVVATTDTFQQAPLTGAPVGYTATRQAAEAQYGPIGPAASVQLVEQWEVAA
jgi:uncharacterized protein DUF6603